MSSQQVAQSTLDEFAAELGLASVALDADGRLTLEIGEMEVTFAFEDEPAPILWIYADLGEVPDGTEAPRALLALAFVSWIANTMTISVTEGGSRAVGFTCVPVALLTAQGLAESFGSLTEAALEVRRRLETGDFSGIDQLGSTASTGAGSLPGIQV